MLFTIVTPSYLVPQQLPACVESIRSQTRSHTAEEMSIQHIIQMGGDPEPNAVSKLSSLLCGHTHYTCELHVQKDTGMYDALNKGFAKAKGEILGHLNADEQYLPGTLSTVSDIFQKHPKVDAVIGAVVVVNPDGDYICSRFPILPTLREVRCLPLSVFTAATFFRASSLQKLGHMYDASYKASGDTDFFEKLIKADFQFHTTKKYFSVFEDNGKNLALSDSAKLDNKRRQARLNLLEKNFMFCTRIIFRFRKLLSGGYHTEPFTYMYLGIDLQPTLKRVTHPSAIWKR